METRQILEHLEELVTRSLDRATHPTPTTALLAIGIALVVLSTPPLWRALRNTITLIHEAGHAIVGIMVGRRLSGIKLHEDTSGLTTTYGSTGVGGWLSARITAFFGYPFPSIVGVALLLAATYGFPRLALLVAWGIFFILLLFMRNLQGIGVMLAHLIGIALLVEYGSDPFLQGVLVGVGSFLVGGGARSVCELWVSHKKGTAENSDVAVLGFGLKLMEGFWFMVYALWYGLAVVVALTLIFSGGIR